MVPVLDAITNLSQSFLGTRLVGVTGFGSYFSRDSAQQASADLDIGVALRGSLDAESLPIIRSMQTALRAEFQDAGYCHIPYYGFSDEPPILNPVLARLIATGTHISVDAQTHTEIFTRAAQARPDGLTALAKEHTQYARTCLLDDMLFSDATLRNAIYKNHTTVAMRMLLQRRGIQPSGGLDVWKAWFETYPLPFAMPPSYAQAVKLLEDEPSSLAIHRSIVAAGGKHE